MKKQHTYPIMMKRGQKKMNKNTTLKQEKTIVIERKITKLSYEKIADSIKEWPQWKKNLCNEELIVSVKSKKV